MSITLINLADAITSHADAKVTVPAGKKDAAKSQAIASQLMNGAMFVGMIGLKFAKALYNGQEFELGKDVNGQSIILSRTNLENGVDSLLCPTCKNFHGRAGNGGNYNVASFPCKLVDDGQSEGLEVSPDKVGLHFANLYAATVLIVDKAGIPHLISNSKGAGCFDKYFRHLLSATNPKCHDRIRAVYEGWTPKGFKEKKA